MSLPQNITSPECGKLLNLDALHFSAEQLTSLNELIVTAVLEAPPLTQYHTLWTGIKNDKYIGLIPKTFGLIGKAAQGCDPEPQCYENPATEKKWEPRYIEFITDICITDFADTLIKYVLNCGYDVYNITNTEVAAFILSILEVDLPKMVFRHAWFGDQAAANFPAGVLTPGVDPAFFNIINGFWVQLAAITAANPLALVAMPGNTQVTYALQQSVATPLLTFNAVNALIDAAPTVLSQQPDRLLLVTRSVFDRLRRQLQALGTAFQDYKLMINGIEFATWDGIPIYSVPLWDEIIRAYEDNGASWNDPHRVLYTTKSNLNVGMACTSLFDKINFFYDQTTRKNRIEAVDAFDAKIFDDNLVMVGR